MTYLAKPRLHHPTLARNKVGYTRRDYEGRVSTLCAGCGHDSISASIIQACWEMDIEPHRVAKLSGIGCSSKTPDYFLGNSHGFNTVHGRMPSVLTGANLANRDGTTLRLRKIHAEYDPTDKIGAMTYIQKHQAMGEVVTGLLYMHPESVDLHEHMNTAEVAFNTLSEKQLCPGNAALDRINAGLR
jgi:hypothetical protein